MARSTRTMIAARLHQIGERLSIDRVPVPDVAAGEVLIDVKASGICHSDINYRDGIVPVGMLPMALGHEVAGNVAAVGRKVGGLRVGDRVVVHYVLNCGRCVYCRKGQENYCVDYRMMGKDVDGGFAEYVKISARNVVKIPKGLPFEQAAIMGCAVPTAYHALKRGGVQRGDTVVMFGVGGLGMHAVQLATKVFKAGLIVAVDVQDWKLEQARSVGAKETVNVANHDAVQEISRMTNGRLGDVTLDFVGQDETIRNAIDSTGKGGRMVLTGIGAKSMQLSPYLTLIGKEMSILGVNDHLKTEMVQLIKLVQSHKLDLSKSVTHKVGLADINRGFDLLERPEEHAVRVVVTE